MRYFTSPIIYLKRNTLYIFYLSLEEEAGKEEKGRKKTIQENKKRRTEEFTARGKLDAMSWKSQTSNYIFLTI